MYLNLYSQDNLQFSLPDGSLSPVKSSTFTQCFFELVNLFCSTLRKKKNISHLISLLVHFNILVLTSLYLIKSYKAENNFDFVFELALQEKQKNDFSVS